VFSTDFNAVSQKFKVASTYKSSIRRIWASRGVGGMPLPLPRKIFRNYVAGDVIWNILGATETRKDMSFLVSFCAVFMQIWQYVLQIQLHLLKSLSCKNCTVVITCNIQHFSLKTNFQSLLFSRLLFSFQDMQKQMQRDSVWLST